MRLDCSRTQLLSWPSTGQDLSSKGKGHPRIGHEGLEGKYRYSYTLSLTSALDMGGERHAPAALPPWKIMYPLHRWLGGPQGRSGRVRNISPPTGIRSRTVQPVASRYRGTTVIDKNSTTALLCVVWKWPELKQRTEKYEFCKSKARRASPPPCLTDKRRPDALSASVPVCSLWPFEDIQNVPSVRAGAVFTFSKEQDSHSVGLRTL